MTTDLVTQFPEELERYLDSPFGGLFGNNVNCNVVEQITADPFRSYRPKDLAQLTERSSRRIHTVLKDLTELKVILKDDSDPQHPIFIPNENSMTLMALTFLAFAISDDRDRSQCMNDAILQYCRQSGLIDKLMPRAIATFREWSYREMTVPIDDSSVTISGMI